ncbi:uncharacterized protein LOC143285230 [Babylonia areolata]|uniref:uncharacterized protein LOC143285230 n=1 Tax=Babylonia areolata TaxID=304850 RepID=UPI003FD1D4A4
MWSVESAVYTCGEVTKLQGSYNTTLVQLAFTSQGTDEYPCGTDVQTSKPQGRSSFLFSPCCTSVQPMLHSRCQFWHDAVDLGEKLGSDGVLVTDCRVCFCNRPDCTAWQLEHRRRMILCPDFILFRRTVVC